MVEERWLILRGNNRIICVTVIKHCDKRVIPRQDNKIILGLGSRNGLSTRVIPYKRWCQNSQVCFVNFATIFILLYLLLPLSPWIMMKDIMHILLCFCSDLYMQAAIFVLIQTYDVFIYFYVCGWCMDSIRGEHDPVRFGWCHSM